MRSVHGCAANTLFESVLHGPARLEGVALHCPGVSLHLSVPGFLQL